MYSIKKQIKEELKELAKNIRIQKRIFKSKQREESVTWSDLRDKYRLETDYRHRHIARCLLRGTPYYKIESKVREGNEPDQKLIQKFKEEYQSRLEEVSNEAS